MIVSMTVIIAVIIALGQLLKNTGVSAKYIPLVSLALGIVAGLVFFDGSIANQILTGIVAGLSASGLYDHTKIVTKKNSIK